MSWTYLRKIALGCEDCVHEKEDDCPENALTGGVPDWGVQHECEAFLPTDRAKRLIRHQELNELLDDIHFRRDNKNEGWKIDEEDIENEPIYESEINQLKSELSQQKTLFSFMEGA